MRAEFTQNVKRILGDRVAWKCCFPGCQEITIGPGKKDSLHVVRLGVAAHITAASEGGPRFDSAISTEERSSIDNAIWLCEKHGEIIDKDATEYSAETLRQWKAQAEEQAHKNLGTLNTKDNYLTTFLAVGPSIICEAEWKSINTNSWTFKIGNFIKGNSDALFAYSMNFNTTGALDKYIIFERQGDGRILDSIEMRNGAGKPEVVFGVLDKFPSQDPNTVGEDIAVDEDGDISFWEDDFKLVTGVEAAKQAIRLTLSLSFGDLHETPHVGSHFGQYYREFKLVPVTLERLLKLEITRLLAIPVHGEYPPSYEPPLPFLKRILSVKIVEKEEIGKQLPVVIKGEWGNGEIFEETFSIFI